jgi:hypothetical protein
MLIIISLLPAKRHNYRLFNLSHDRNVGVKARALRSSKLMLCYQLTKARQVDKYWKGNIDSSRRHQIYPIGRDSFKLRPLGAPSAGLVSAHKADLDSGSVSDELARIRHETADDQPNTNVNISHSHQFRHHFLFYL